MATTTLPLVDQRNELVREKFIHVTGLPVYDATSDEEEPIQAPQFHLGHWGCDDGCTVAILENGEVWIYGGMPDKEMLKILRRVCPLGNRATPPRILPCFSYGLGRHANPFENFGGAADPTPKPQY